MSTHDMEEAETMSVVIAIMHQGRVVAMGAPAELKAQVGPGARMDDVFVYHTGNALETGEEFHDVRQTRRTANRLGYQALARGLHPTDLGDRRGRVAQAAP
ncbi:hypothetical protein D3C86_1791600 [compost metagenome]